MTMDVVDNAPSLSAKVEQLAKDANISIPAVVVASFVAFLLIIGLSWLMDGGTFNASSGDSKTTPESPTAAGATGYVDTPSGRRSTRKSKKPKILDPSQFQ